jgi:hypothetical protein
MQNNSAGLWDRYWEGPIDTAQDVIALEYEKSTISWQRIEKAVLKQFTSFQNLKVVEIGAGRGTNAALMNIRGAKTTIVDYSDGALKRSREFFERNGLMGEHIKLDVISIPDGLIGRYDIAMSFGFAEHFSGPARIAAFKAHFDLIRKNGLAIISVPNKFSLPYRIFKGIAEQLNHWPIGEEYPFTRKELSDICHRHGILEFNIEGDSFVSSFNFLNPLKRAFIRRALNLKNRKITRIREQKGSFLDKYLSYALIVFAKK